MQQIQVKLAERSYLIDISQNLLHSSAKLVELVQDKQVLVVTNETIAPLYLDRLIAQLSCAKQVETTILPDGEQYKTMTFLDQIFQSALTHHYGRDCVMIALGGGVIGDMTGFAASCYQRGVPFIQIPTTLLSQVDSSVGGKTAVNHELGKNMIGAFYQPQYVLIETDTLKTLPAREFAAGMAEVIKYGIIWDADFFAFLEQNVERLKQQDAAVLAETIAHCCRIKAEVVAEDETEHGVRALLNLGHTFGHAIEAEMGYGQWLHGEAVAAGMVLAAQTAYQRNLIKDVDLQRIIALLIAFDLPIKAPKSMTFASFIKHMRRDKKVIKQQIRFILPEGIGQASIYSDVDDALLERVIAHA